MAIITIIDGTLHIDGLPYVLAAKAAPHLGISPNHLSRLAKAGKLRAARYGNRWYFNLEVLRSHRRTQRR